MGITIQGNGIIDGRGSVWWQDHQYDGPIDDEEKLIIPLNKTVGLPPLPVIFVFYHEFLHKNELLPCVIVAVNFFKNIIFFVVTETCGDFLFFTMSFCCC